MSKYSELTNFFQIHQIKPPSCLFDGLADTFYFAKNLNGEFVYTNKLINENFNTTDSNDVIGKTDYDFFRTDIADRIRADDLRVMEQDIVINNKLEVLQDGKGCLNWLFTTKVPLRNSTGDIIGVEGISKDARRLQKGIEPYSMFKGCMEYLQKNYANQIYIEQLAKLTCMSISTFERKFKKHFACTPKQYIKRFRIQEACRMLIAGYSILRVATECGFCDQSYFTLEFRSVMGVTPKYYQNTQKISQEEVLFTKTSKL